jgi:hypothetical protein
LNLIGFAFGLRGEGGAAIRKGVIDRGHLRSPAPDSAPAN